jgi:hypothetical protein
VRVHYIDHSINAVGEITGVFVRIKHKYTVWKDVAFLNVTAYGICSHPGPSAINSNLLAVIT